jgi:hypothetical protein
MIKNAADCETAAGVLSATFNASHNDNDDPDKPAGCFITADREAFFNPYIGQP